MTHGNLATRLQRASCCCFQPPARARPSVTSAPSNTMDSPLTADRATCGVLQNAQMPLRPGTPPAFRASPTFTPWLLCRPWGRVLHHHFWHGKALPEWPPGLQRAPLDTTTRRRRRGSRSCARRAGAIVAEEQPAQRHVMRRVVACCARHQQVWQPAQAQRSALQRRGIRSGGVRAGHGASGRLCRQQLQHDLLRGRLRRDRTPFRASAFSSTLRRLQIRQLGRAPA